MVDNSDSDSDSDLSSIAEEPDTLEDFLEEPDLHWLADDQVKEMHEKFQVGSVKIPPPLKDWKEIDPLLTKYQITVGKARRVLWAQFKQEHRLFHNNAQKIKASLDGSPSSSSQQVVYDFLFGKSSKIARLFMDRLNLDETKYLLFLFTFFKSCRYKMPVPALEKSIDNFHVMPTSEYNSIWSAIYKLGRNARGESFWQELELLVNVNFMELFLGPNDDPETDAIRKDMDWLLGLDDDKLHYNHGRTTDTDGLKKDHHAQDNRRGFTAHTCCLSATSVPIQVVFQREQETVVSCTQRLINDLYGKHTGQAGRLDDVSFFMDRGYWNARVFFTLLDQGAHIHGTIKRMDWVPFTYVKGKKKADGLKDEDEADQFPLKPKRVNMQGYKDTHHMALDWKGKRKVDLFAYRSGTGNAVAMVASSVHRRDHFDFTPLNEADQAWYHDKDLPALERKKKAMKLLIGNHKEECAEQLFDLVDPRTCTQGTADWFVDRQFSGTSSTICSIIVAVAPLVDEEEAPELWAAFQTVLNYAGVDSSLLGSVLRQEREDELAAEADEAERVAEAEAEAAEEAAVDLDAEDEELEPQELAKRWIRRLTKPETAFTDADFNEHLMKDDDTIRRNIEVLRWMQALAKKVEKKNSTAAQLKKFFADWIAKDRPRRPYEWLTIASLKEVARKQGVGLKKQGKKSEIIDELVKPKDQQQPLDDESALDPKLAPYLTLFRQTFLKPQNEVEQSAASIGHRNEEPFLKAFYNKALCNEAGEFSFARLKPKAIYRVGLMRKSGSKFAKASLDGVAFLEDDGDIECVPIEVKSRVSAATMTEAAERIEEVVGVECYNPKARYLFQADSSDPLLRLLLHDNKNTRREHHESLQLLHGAHVTSSRRGVLLVGSGTSLMCGIDINFEESLLDSYETVMDHVYDHYFKPFYESSPVELNQQLGDTIQAAIDKLEQLDLHSFWTNYGAWRALNVDVNSANVTFPLPPSARFLPFQNAYWNAMKGPSDTTTKLIDKVEEQLGIRKPRNIATARLLTITGVAFHRSNQMIKTKVHKHKTIFNCRHAANRKVDMSISMDFIIRCIAGEMKALEQQSTPNTQAPFPLLAAPQTPPQRSLRGWLPSERVTWGNSLQTGFTPCRGRALNERHQLREQLCDGRVLLYRVSDPNEASTGNKKKDVRGPCRLCKAKTAFYCSGCKNYLCFGSAGLNEKKAKQIASQLEQDETPKEFIRIPFFDPKEEAWKHFFASNSCYLIQHKSTFDSKDWQYSDLDNEQQE